MEHRETDQSKSSFGGKSAQGSPSALQLGSINDEDSNNKASAGNADKSSTNKDDPEQKALQAALVDPLLEAKKTYWDKENNIFINQLNFICKNYNDTFKTVSRICSRPVTACSLFCIGEQNANADRR